MALLSTFAICLAGTIALNTSILHASEDSDASYDFQTENADEASGDVVQMIEVFSEPEVFDETEPEIVEAVSEAETEGEESATDVPAVNEEETHVESLPNEETAEDDPQEAEDAAGEAADEAEMNSETEPEEEDKENEEGSEQDEKKTEERVYNVYSYFVNCSEGPVSIGSIGCWICEIEGLIGDETITYQWQFSADNASWIDIGGANDAAYYFTVTEENAGYFWRVVADIQ